VAKVYGEAMEYLEEKDSIPGVIEIDHGVTASSMLWPNWPDDVPWRSFEGTGLTWRWRLLTRLYKWARWILRMWRVLQRYMRLAILSLEYAEDSQT
jgi:hypothetical protein